MPKKVINPDNSDGNILNDTNLDSTNFSFEVTKDKKLLNQYYSLREECFKERLSVKHFNGKEDFYDQNGIVVLILFNEQVIGGGRIIISSPKNRILLPLEDESFRIKDLFPELNLNKYSYCEISRIAIKKGFRTRSLNIGLSKMLLEAAVSEGCVYQFSIGPITQARNSSIIGKRIGYIHQIQNGINIPYRETFEQYNDSVCIAITYLKEGLAQAHNQYKKEKLIS